VRDSYPSGSPVSQNVPPFASGRRLVSQINDSSESVIANTANIVDGFGRGTQGEFIQFLGYAMGSFNET